MTEATDTQTAAAAARHAGRKVSTKSVDMPQVRNKTFILTTKAPSEAPHTVHVVFTRRKRVRRLVCSLRNKKRTHGLRLGDVSTERGAMGAEHVATERFPAEDAPAQPGGKTSAG